MSVRALKPSQVLSLIVFAVGVFVLFGWALGNDMMTRVFPGFIAMKANTALCFVLFGLSGFFSSSPNRLAKLVAGLAAAAGGLIAVLTLGQIFLGWNFRIDEFLFVDTLDPSGTAVPGRMAPLTAVCFTLLGLASAIGRATPIRVRQTAVISVLAIGVSGFVSYPFSLISGVGLYSATGMALLTAFLFVLLGTVQFIEQSDLGLGTVLLSRSPLGDNTRSLLATVILAPFALGWLAFAGESADFFDAGVARLYFSISVMLLLTVVVVYNAQRLFEAERAHQMLATDFHSVQNQLQALVENSPSAIFIKDVGGRYQLVNSHFERLLEKPRAQILGKKAPALYKKDLISTVIESDRRVIETKDVVVTEMKTEVDGQPRTYLNTKFPLFDQKGEVESIGGIWTDITEQKTLSETLNTKNVDLERSNRELEQFAYVASHDLQEPLRMVSSYMQLLESRYKDKLDKDASEFIGYAVDGAQRMQRLIQDLLAFSRIGTRGKAAEPVESQEALDEALQNLKMRIEETKAEIFSEALPRVLADKNQLAQVFQNLLGNAIKFSGDKPPKINISVSQSLGFAEFHVKDNGIGFDPKHADRIFVLFQRLNNREQYEGTGIGLAICKKIVERHGGQIWVESQMGKGSSFHFTFPLATEEMPKLEEKQVEFEEGEAETIEERAGRLI